MVTADPDEAEAALCAGEHVVLIVPTEFAVGLPVGRGLGLFVGDPHDPAVWAAARDMDAELAAGRRET